MQNWFEKINPALSETGESKLLSSATKSKIQQMMQRTFSEKLALRELRGWRNEEEWLGKGDLQILPFQLLKIVGGEVPNEDTCNNFISLALRYACGIETTAQQMIEGKTFIEQIDLHRQFVERVKALHVLNLAQFENSKTMTLGRLDHEYWRPGIALDYQYLGESLTQITYAKKRVCVGSTRGTHQISEKSYSKAIIDEYWSVQAKGVAIYKNIGDRLEKASYVFAEKILTAERCETEQQAISLVSRLTH